MSDKISWDDKYSVGITTIDKHHQKLFAIIDDIEKLLQEDADKFLGKISTALNNTLNELMDYTDYHFSLEESMMAKIKYNKLKEHVILHHEFIKNISEFKSQVEIVGPSEMCVKLLDVLKQWLLTHILFVDQDYTNYFKQL